MQNREKISPRRSSTVVSPVISPSARSAACRSTSANSSGKSVTEPARGFRECLLRPLQAMAVPEIRHQDAVPIRTFVPKQMAAISCPLQILNRRSGLCRDFRPGPVAGVSFFLLRQPATRATSDLFITAMPDTISDALSIPSLPQQAGSLVSTTSRSESASAITWKLRSTPSRSTLSD